MKTWFLFALMFCPLLMIQCEDVEEPPEPDLLHVNLNGYWDAYGYWCFQDEPQLEIVQIIHKGDSVILIKTIGDGCVTKGHVTIEGIYNENPFQVQSYVGAPNIPNSNTDGGTLQVITPDLLLFDSFGSIYFVRKKQYYP